MPGDAGAADRRADAQVVPSGDARTDGSAVGDADAATTSNDATQKTDLVETDGPATQDAPTGTDTAAADVTLDPCADSRTRCDDKDPCTDDTCDASSGACSHQPTSDGRPCADGDVCNGAETCRSGVCVAGTAPTCDDANPCTSDTCNRQTGCQHAAVVDGTSCSDGDVCNGAEVCRAGACSRGTALVCDDKNPCTTDTCAPATGCTHTAVSNGTACADSNMCNGSETCQGGVCAAGTGPNCDDANPCTTDGCNGSTGCTHTLLPNGILLPDADLCNGDEYCWLGEWKKGTPLACDDGDPCTIDSCDAKKGCTHSPAPTTAEICGDGLDNDCDGAFDEDCGCAGVGPGRGGSMPVPPTVSKLVPDPAHCRIYALDQATPAQVIVIDANARTEITRVPLPAGASDLDVSPDGRWAAVSLSASPQFLNIDTTTFATTAYNTTYWIRDIEVGNDGNAYYFAMGYVRVNLATGATQSGPYDGNYYPDLELSEDGKTLYAQNTSTNALIYRLDVSSGIPGAPLDTLPWQLLAHFGLPTPWMYLAPGRNVLYASNYQLDAGNLNHVFNYMGRSTTFDGGEPIYAEDRKGTFAVGATAIYDAQFLHPVAALPRVADAATLMAADKEIWYQSGGALYYVNAPQFLTGATLNGDRQVLPEPTSAHEVTHFIVDSKRNRLYALDLLDDLLIAIDGATLKPIAALRTNRGPSDIDMDLAQDSIYVAHQDNTLLLRVNADKFTVDKTVWMPGEVDVIRARLADTTCFVSADVVGLHEQIALHDMATGAILFTTDTGTNAPIFGGIAVAGDNKTVYVGNSALTAGQLYRFVVQRPSLSLTGVTRYNMGQGFPSPSASTVMTPDATNIFFARYSISGSNMDVLNYKVDDPMMAVTLDGRLAASNDHVYRTSDGAVVLTLPKYTTDGPQGVAFTPDGKTLILTPPHSPMLTFDVSAL